jgi:hypothetical protein
MIDQQNFSMLKRLVEQWNQVRSEVRRMHQGVQVRPDDINTLLRPIDGPDADVAYFRLQPVVFNLPERATYSDVDLYVVVEGLISYRRPEFAQDKRLLTNSFATHAAYFRRTRDSLLHVFGVHYDYSGSDIGHPAFHGQMKSFADLGELVKQQYRLDLPVKDSVKGVLNRVRVPTAQMDVFSVFVQMCADHLLHPGSSKDEVSAFDTLLTRSRFCVGAAFQLPRLATEEARTCYRARHWYPAAT